MKSRARELGLPAFLPLFAAYPVLFISAANPGQASLATVAVVAAASVSASLLIWLVLRIPGKSTLAAAVGAGFLVLTFFTYGQFANWLDSYVLSLGLGDFETPNALDLVPNARRNVALAWGVVSVLLAMLIARSTWARSPQLGRALGFSAAGLVILTLVQLSGGLLRSGQATELKATAVASESRPATARVRPDIYFIVLDGYARHDVLARYYAFDNTPFLDALRSRGLQVSNETSSNYAWTFLSLASTLNMGYVQDLFAGRLGPASLDRSMVYDSIRDNATARFLREQGYEIVHIRSTWGATSVNPYADREIRCESSAYTNEFVRAVAEASWLGAFHTKAGVDLAKCNLANFEALQHVRDGARPKFVFAHFVLPHHPYLFDKDGNILRNAVVSNQFEFQKRLWEDRDSYRAQLEFVNSRILATVDALIKTAASPPVIMIESDHGPGIVQGLSETGHYAVRFANLGAYYLPGAPPDLMPHSGSAVNQFRRVLSYYFGAKLDPLPDRHFASPNARPYAFREVPHELLREWWTRMNGGPQADPHATAVAQVVEQTDD